MGEGALWGVYRVIWGVYRVIWGLRFLWDFSGVYKDYIGFYGE